MPLNLNLVNPNAARLATSNVPATSIAATITVFKMYPFMYLHATA